MRIRKYASRLLGSAYSSVPPDPAPRFELPLPPPPPPPPPPARPCPSAPESQAGGSGFATETASWEPCEQSLSPWDLIGKLDLSDPQEEELVVDSYLVHVAWRASWLLPTSMLAASVKEEEMATVEEASARPRHKVAKKTAAKKTVIKKKEKKKESEPKTKAKVKTEEEDGVAAGGAQIWTCKKNDGKRWFCQRAASRPNSLCQYHSDQKRLQYNPFSESTSTALRAAAPSAASKPSTSSKPRKKKAVDVGEGFYYYAGFGPSRTTKRQCRSSIMQESAPAEQEEEAQPKDHAAPTADQAQADAAADHEAATRNDEPSFYDMAGIAGGDEESSDDGNGEPRVVGVNGDSKRKSPLKKRWRKPVKARSLKSLM